ncbi:hypothetical protein ROHU_031603 [Labeo rohita]|uniref:Uncharacterized protein n=1 Tax=Labeo rohita TaxID=84645 RepID=A0A498LNY8_LABRO|nr:hypothetical protein ROHU_031603 [Labeo rohita]
MSSSVSKVKLIQGAEERNPPTHPSTDARLKSVRYKDSVHAAVLPPSGPVDTEPSGSGAFHLLRANRGIAAHGKKTNG